MAENPLFYRSIVPLNREQHRDLKCTTGEKAYGFAKSAHVIPAVVDEFVAAARHLPIVFLPTSGVPAPVFLLGLKPGTNLCVDDAGGWTGGYIPAFARRYPFMMGEVEGGDPVACIDTGGELLNTASGEALFNEDGTDAPFLTRTIQFLNDYFQAAKRTDAAMKTISDLKLLQTVTIEARLTAGDTATLHGFMSLDEQRLAALSDEEFLQLRRDNLLAPLMAQAWSLGSVDTLRIALEKRQPGAGATQATPAAA